MSKNTTPLERDEQITLVNWLEIKKLTFTAIPNSTYTTSWKQKRLNTATGLRAGFPDMIVLIPANRCIVNRSVMLCIELKRQKGGVTKPHQKEWIKQLNEIADVESKVCKGFAEARDYINIFLTK